MEKKQKTDLTKFEVMVETSQGTLVGGFSTSASTSLNISNIVEPSNTNCAGANCVAGCTSNTVAGCGTNKTICL